MTPTGHIWVPSLADISKSKNVGFLKHLMTTMTWLFWMLESLSAYAL